MGERIELKMFGRKMPVAVYLTEKEEEQMAKDVLRQMELDKAHYAMAKEHDAFIRYLREENARLEDENEALRAKLAKIRAFPD